MKKKAVISIKGEQSFQNLERENLELVTNGTLYEKSGAFYLVYDESELTGLPNTKTTVKISQDGVSVLRTGKFPSTMIFEENRQNVSLYRTPYGEMSVTVTTEKIDSEISMEDGGNINVLYSLGLDHNHIGKNNLNINIKVV